MNKEKFEVLLPIFITDLIKKSIEQKNILQDEAISLLYNSKLYDLLNDEESKVWHYSTDKLFQLFEEELNSGSITLPEC